MGDVNIVDDELESESAKESHRPSGSGRGGTGVVSELVNLLTKTDDTTTATPVSGTDDFNEPLTDATTAEFAPSIFPMPADGLYKVFIIS